MKIQFLKKLLPVLISGATLSALACAWGDWSGQEGSMYTPEIINMPGYRPFFRTLETPFYDGYSDNGRDTLAKLNVADWTAYFENKVNGHAVKYWMYTASLSRIDSMIFVLKGKPYQLRSLPPDYNLQNRQVDKKALSFLFYLGFAKRNETFFAFEEDRWNDKPKAALYTLPVQIAGGIGMMKNAKEDFVKARYAFQLLRLYYLDHQYDKGLELWEQNKALFAGAGDNMKWRALGYRAACCYKLQRFSEANAIYAQIYDGFEPLRRTAYLSFHPQNGAEWQQTLSLAPTVKEKATLWQLMGLYTNSIKAMQEILALDPSSDRTDLLLVRAVNIEEEKFSEFSEFNNNGAPTLDEKLNAFLNETAASPQKLHNPAAWVLAAAYLNYLKKDFALGDKLLANAEKYAGRDPLVKAEYHLLRVIGKIYRMQKLTPGLEKDLVPDLVQLFKSDDKYFRSDAAIEQVRNILSKLAEQNGEMEKSELIKPDVHPKHFSSDENIRKMISYYEKPDLSGFEQVFFARSRRSQADYKELLGIRLTVQDKLEEALAAYRSIPAHNKTLYGNPFTIHIKDCHDCDHNAPQKIKYTSTAFVEKMLEMKKTAQGKPTEAPQNYFLIANGFYNLTWYGNARYFSHNEVYSGFYNYGDSLCAPQKCDLALKYYLLARALSNDPEFRAKCTFMAAKCSDNWSYSYLGVYAGEFMPEPGAYFDEMKKQYSKTKYYSEIIRECTYFKHYLAKGN